MLIGVIDAISSSGLYRAKLTACGARLRLPNRARALVMIHPFSLSLSWLGNEIPDTTRTALSARTADVGEPRKTKNELPPPHAPP